jgi:hypothetical protein
MSMASGKLDASSGLRVNSARLDSGRESCIGLSCSGRRKAWTNVERSAGAFCSSETFTEIEGIYLNRGKRKAEAVEVGDEGGKDEFETKTLLNGYRIAVC